VLDVITDMVLRQPFEIGMNVMCVGGLELSDLRVVQEENWPLLLFLARVVPSAAWVGETPHLDKSIHRLGCRVCLSTKVGNNSGIFEGCGKELPRYGNSSPHNGVEPTQGYGHHWLSGEGGRSDRILLSFGRASFLGIFCDCQFRTSIFVLGAGRAYFMMTSQGQQPDPAYKRLESRHNPPLRGR
jgi:hypothetical protein